MNWKSLCVKIGVSPVNDTLLRITTPFSFPDGDLYEIYLKVLPTSVLRLSDMGNTFMRLSYENEAIDLRGGARGKLLDQILAEFDVVELNGEIYKDSNVESLPVDILKFGQVLTRLYDLSLLMHPSPQHLINKV